MEKETKKDKKLQSYYIDCDVLRDFDVVTSMLKVPKSQLINDFITDYVTKNKAQVNEMMLSYWKNNIKKNNED